MYITAVNKKTSYAQARCSTYSEKVRSGRVTAVAAETQKYNLCVVELRGTVNYANKLSVAQ